LLSWRECRCNYCSAILPNYYQLYQHVAQGHQVSLLPCWLCTRTFRRGRELSQHLLDQHLTEFDCPSCGQVFDRWSALKRHVCAHTTEESTLADRAGRSCTIKSCPPTRTHTTLTLNLLNKQNGAFVCGQPGCRLLFKVASELRKHLASEHGQTARNAQLKSSFQKLLTCSACGRSLNGWQAYRKHSRSHANPNILPTSKVRKQSSSSKPKKSEPAVVSSLVTIEDNLLSESQRLAAKQKDEAATSLHPTISCTHCTRTFANHRQMLKHRAASHF
jgi:uncharacterized C2H2 Zn-finger protein